MLPNKRNPQNYFRADWWKKRLRSFDKSGSSGPVGTEAVAIANIKKNTKNFVYPSEGFQTCIEHSLLYAMISEPDMYPDEAVLLEISDEDFFPYTVVAQTSTSISRKKSLTDRDGIEQLKISYAQLSAILGLSAEKNHPKDNRSESINQGEDSTKSVVFEKLCKKIIKSIIQYSEDNNLDRESEVKELLGPVEKHSTRRLEKAVWKDIFQTSVFYAASISTGSLPLVFAVAAGAIVSPEPLKEETNNVATFRSDANRAADVEQSGLLDETDDDYS